MVFLSYAHEDLEKVKEFYASLKRRGVQVWFDKEDMKQGKWKPQILKAITRSRYFIICISNAALKKTSGEKPGFQEEELQYAYEIAVNQPEDKFTIIPVMLEQCEERGDHRLNIFQQYDLYEDWDRALDKLAVNIGGSSLADAQAKDERSEEKKLIDGMIGKGNTYYYSGEYNKALTIYNAVIGINPDYYTSWINKGIILEKLGRLLKLMKR